jgi:hypothetical protein
MQSPTTRLLMMSCSELIRLQDQQRLGPVGSATIAGVQARKLGLKPGQRVALDDPPPGWAFTDPPGGLEMAGQDEDATDAADVIVAFFARAADLGLRLPGLAERIFPDGAVWAAWPRRAGGHTSDITDNVVREYALPLGLVDVLVAAIDDDWSGLRLVWRKENRRRPG